METIASEEWDAIGAVLASRYADDDEWLADVVIPDEPCPRGKDPLQAQAETNAIWGTRFEVMVKTGAGAIRDVEAVVDAPGRRHDPHQAVQYLLDIGLTFREVSVALDRPIEEVLVPFTRTDADIPQAVRIVAALEAAKASGLVSFTDISEKLCGDRALVEKIRRLARAQGIQSNATKLRTKVTSRHREAKPRALRMLGEGMTLGAVSSKTGVPESTLGDWAHAEGIRLAPQGRPRAEIDWGVVRSRRADGESWAKIAEDTECSASTLRMRATKEM